MSKAKEFWLFETGMSAGDGYSEYAVTTTVPTEAIQDHVHVREVVPIDWDKVWEIFEHDAWGVSMANFQKALFQQLVEKQLAGEE